jgi:hypothetical protein
MEEVIARFGSCTPQRPAVTTRLLRVYDLVKATGLLERFILFGSYVTDKPTPNDVDIFIVMARSFGVEEHTGATRTVFSHAQAESDFGVSVFWAYHGVDQVLIDDLVEGWQMRRDRTPRGIVEVVE